MFKRTLITVTILIAGMIITYLIRMFPIISAVGAKTMCSCVFVSGRNSLDVDEQELGGLFVNWGRYEVNFMDSSATGSVLGGWEKKAIYRPGYGCTLVNGLSEEEIRAQYLPKVWPPPVDPDTVVWPGGNIIKDTLMPEVDYSTLEKVVEQAFYEPDPSRPRRTRAVVVVYKNQLIAEKYASGFNPEQLQMGWSMAKSVTSALTGVLTGEGILNINERAPVEAWADPADDRHDITLDQLLRMSSGLKWNESYFTVSPATRMLFKLPDAGKFAASQKLAHPPDSVWYYSSGTSNIISMIIRMSVPENEYYNFPRKELFYPAGMYSFVLEPDPGGTFVGSSYTWATPRDWARFGMLYLNDGHWEGTRILPDGWVDYTSTPTPKAPKGEYGAHFWLNSGPAGKPGDRIYPDVPTDAFFANGFEGQSVFIIPSKDLVIVRMGQTQLSEFDFNEFVSGIVNAVD